MTLSLFHRLLPPPTLSIPLFFRINAVGTIPFQLSLRINPLFDVSRLLAIKRANGTRGWRRAMGASVTADGGCTNNKMAAGGAPPAPPSLCQRMRRDASLARGRKGCFAKGKNAARTLSILSKCLAVWNIGRAASLSQPVPPISRSLSPSSNPLSHRTPGDPADSAIVKNNGNI